MSEKLDGMRVAILSEEGFEQSELLEPKKALEAAGAKTFVISSKKGKIKGWKRADWGEEVMVDVQLENVKRDDYDALLLPGGVINPDKLRVLPEAVEFVRHFFNQKNRLPPFVTVPLR
jgi:protease I